MAGSRRLAVLIGLVAVAAIVGVVVSLEQPPALPRPNRGRQVVPACPPAAGRDYFDPSPTLIGARAAPFQGGAWLAAHLRAADAQPLWCGDKRDVAYRLILVIEYGKTKIITIQRTAQGGALDGTEFKHPAVARLDVERRVKRPLSSADITRLERMLADENFWLLPTREPEPRDACCYDGPNWLIEARADGGYHIVTRAWDRKEIIDSARLIQSLAGLPGEQNTAPDNER